MPVSFFLNGKLKTFRGKTKLINRIKILAFLECKEIGEISVILLSDEDLLKINIDYLNHDYYTDIITFDYSEGCKISGDLYISVDRVKENAQKYGYRFEEELKRVIIHGILHLCGYNDKSRKEQHEMRKKEDYYLALDIN